MGSNLIEAMLVVTTVSFSFLTMVKAAINWKTTKHRYWFLISSSFVWFGVYFVYGIKGTEVFGLVLMGAGILLHVVFYVLLARYKIAKH